MRTITRLLQAGLLSIVLASSSGCSNDESTARPSTDAGADASDDAISRIQVRVKDFVFDVRVAGPESGEPVILLHGFPETSYEWRYQLSALARAGYRAIAPDQRGYSPGARPTEVSAYTVIELAGDVLGIADAMHVQKFHLAGHDWGAGVAWALARLAANRVVSFVPMSVPHPDALQQKLVDPASCQHQASSYFDFFASPDSLAFFLADDRKVLRASYGGVSQDAVAEYVNALGNEAALTAALDWYRANITDRKFNTPPLGAVTVPTAYIWGDADGFFCRDTVELTAQFMQGPYELEVLSGINHWTPENAPEAVTTIMLDLFRAHPVE